MRQPDALTPRQFDVCKSIEPCRAAYDSSTATVTGLQHQSMKVLYQPQDCPRAPRRAQAPLLCWPRETALW